MPAAMQAAGGDGNGAYVFFFSVPGIKGTWTHDSQGSFRCVIPSRDCGAPQSGHEHQSADEYNLGGTSVSIKLDPRQPRSFSGTTTEIIDTTNGLDRTITWDLHGR